ncbi:MAG TPA: PDZ domain-containing protein [Longimicrobiaceae bacterium]
MNGRGRLAVLVGALSLFAVAEAGAQEATDRRGWLGFVWEATEAEGGAIRIENVYPGSPAADAGIRDGDVIVRWNGETDVERALERLRLQPGDSVRVRVRRGNDRDRDLLIVAERKPTEVYAVTPRREPGFFGLSPEELEEVQRAFRESQREMAKAFRELRMDSRMDSLSTMLRDSLGPRLREMNDEIRLMVPDGTSRTVIALGSRSVAGAEFEEMNAGLSSYFGVDRGALVLRVAPDTPAGRAGLRPGDVVLEANDREVESIADLRTAISRAQRDRPREVELEILRKGQRQSLELTWE